MRVLLCILLVAILAIGAIGTVNASLDGAQAMSQSEQVSDISLIDRLSVWIYTEQRRFHRLLNNHMSRLSANNGNWEIIWSLIGVSFLYGVFHAAGPGHGKAIVSSYLLSHRQTLRRGVCLAVSASMCQGLVAIMIVYGLVYVIGWLPRDTQLAVTWGERASFILVALLGGYLAMQALRRLFARMRGLTVHACSHGIAADHGVESCGHGHVPTMAQVEAAKDIKSMIAVVLSIGLRPCTGAIIVLVFASVTSLHWIGIGAVIGMSVGTAITVSLLAILAGTVRHHMERMSWLSGQYVSYTIDIVATLGGIAILLIGMSLIFSAFGQQHPIIGM